MSLVCCFSPQGRVWWDFSPCLGVAFTGARGCAWAKRWHEDVRSCNHQWLFNPVQPLLLQCSSFSFGSADFAQQWSSCSFGFCSVTVIFSRVHETATFSPSAVQWICNFRSFHICTHLTVLTWILLLWAVVPQP